MPNMIKIWPWETAPKKYKKLSALGGDEDWLVYVPGEYHELVSVQPWVQALDTENDPQMTQLDNGDWIYIGGHA